MNLKAPLAISATARGHSANVAQVPFVGIGNWAETFLSATGKGDVNTIGRTQFRLDYSAGSGTTYEAWSAGDVAGKEPQLIVRFSF